MSADAPHACCQAHRPVQCQGSPARADEAVELHSNLSWMEGSVSSPVCAMLHGVAARFPPLCRRISPHPVRASTPSVRNRDMDDLEHAARTRDEAGLRVVDPWA